MQAEGGLTSRHMVKLERRLALVLPSWLSQWLPHTGDATRAMLRQQPPNMHYSVQLDIRKITVWALSSSLKVHVIEKHLEFVAFCKHGKVTQYLPKWVRSIAVTLFLLSTGPAWPLFHSWHLFHRSTFSKWVSKWQSMFPIKVLGDNYSDGKCARHNRSCWVCCDATNHTKLDDFM